MSALTRALKTWLPIAAAATCLFGATYLALQQDLRTSANEPQIQLAEDAAVSLDAGAAPQAVIPMQRVEISRSVAPWVMVFDKSGRTLASSALLNGQSPDFPKGVFDNVRNGGEDSVTWQPRSEVRSATVTVRYNNGFVTAGRSLRLVEQREDRALAWLLAGWLAALAASAGVAVAAAAFIRA